jgi:hypothetical protein
MVCSSLTNSGTVWFSHIRFYAYASVPSADGRFPLPFCILVSLAFARSRLFQQVLAHVSLSLTTCSLLLLGFGSDHPISCDICALLLSTSDRMFNDHWLSFLIRRFWLLLSLLVSVGKFTLSAVTLFLVDTIADLSVF